MGNRQSAAKASRSKRRSHAPAAVTVQGGDATRHAAPVVTGTGHLGAARLEAPKTTATEEDEPAPTVASPQKTWQHLHTTVDAVKAFHEPIDAQCERAQQRRERQVAVDKDPAMFFATHVENASDATEDGLALLYAHALLRIARGEHAAVVDTLRILSCSSAPIAEDAKYRLAHCLVHEDPGLELYGQQVRELLEVCTRAGGAAALVSEARELFAHVRVARAEHADAMTELRLAPATPCHEAEFQAANCTHHLRHSTNDGRVTKDYFKLSGQEVDPMLHLLCVDSEALLVGPQ